MAQNNSPHRLRDAILTRVRKLCEAAHEMIRWPTEHPNWTRPMVCSIIFGIFTGRLINLLNHPHSLDILKIAVLVIIGAITIYAIETLKW